jgi:hypothetical protein
MSSDRAHFVVACFQGAYSHEIESRVLAIRSPHLDQQYNKYVEQEKPNQQVQESGIFLCVLSRAHIVSILLSEGMHPNVLFVRFG